MTTRGTIGPRERRGARRGLEAWTPPPEFTGLGAGSTNLSPSVRGLRAMETRPAFAGRGRRVRKPGSVARPSCLGRAGGHSSGTRVAARLEPPTRGLSGPRHRPPT